MMSKKIKSLEEEILKHKKLYYSGNAEISDEQYDFIENSLRELDPSSNVLKLVGSSIESKDKVKHDNKMLSLGKTYKIEDLINWKSGQDIVSTFKIDGSSCSLIYNNGLLNIGKTRGDGSYGENITEKVKYIPSVPLSINTKKNIEVRGEVFCTEENFYLLSEHMEKLGLEKPASQRNIVAGLLGRKENIHLCRYLNFQAFELISNVAINTEVEKFKSLTNEGFEVPHYELHKGDILIKEKLEEARKFISEGNYLIDGLVFTFNNISLHNEMGETSHHPRYKLAFKFQGESKTTILNSITWQISRNGIATPVGEIEPIELSGAKISRVTLHNYGMVKQFQLKEGDEIEIVRSGEVIPKFLSVINSSDFKFKVPDKCPSCGNSLEVVSIRLICQNKKCPAQILEEILHFIKKIGIDDLNSKRLVEMINAGIVTDIPSLYDITKEQLLGLDKVKDKLASKIIENINKSRKVDLVKFLSSLGISGVSQNKIEKIVNHGLKTIGDFQELKIETLLEIESFAEKSAADFVESLSDKKLLIKDLVEKHLVIESLEEVTGSKLKGFKFCITGTLSMKRGDIEKLIKNNGGLCIGSVTKNTDYLVTNDVDSSSSKFVKAKKLKIPIINEDILLSMVNTGPNYF